MADKKISALTNATTPLAGTEVLPIVQSGSTVKVAVSSLTAGRDVSATSIAAGLGAVGTPAYTFTGDLNTGMWSPSADVVAFSTAGNERFRADSSGNFGVGTASPATKLDVVGVGIRSVITGGASVGAPLGSQIYLGDNNFVGGFALQGPGIGAVFNAVTNVAGDLAFYTYSGSARTERMRVTAAGNLAISTAGQGITNSTGSVALNFSTVGTALTGGAQSVLTGSFNNVGTAQTVTPDDTRGGNIVITAIQPGIGSTTYTLPFVKRGGTVAIGTPSKAILTADPILTVAASGGGIVITPVAANTFITYAIYYTPLGA